MVNVDIPKESLSLYFTEVKDSQHANIDFEVELLDEVEQASDFLHKAGLSDLSKIHKQGKEISDTIVNDSIRQRNLTEKQAQTVKSRVRTLNRTLANRQARRKQRQDIRDFAWNLETSSTGSRSRSATPDSLDSTGALHEDSTTSDEDQQLSLPTFPLDNVHVFKGKLKWTSSEPIPTKPVFNRHDRADVAHLGSDNVVLKGYHPLNEYQGNVKIRERSASDTNHEVVLNNNIENTRADNYCYSSFISGTSESVPNDIGSSGHTHTMENEAISFEELVRHEEVKNIPDLNASSYMKDKNLVSIDSLSDSEYQHLKPLLWVELAAIFDQYKIGVLKRKANNKHKRGNVFGVNLATLVMRDNCLPNNTPDITMVPQIYQRILSLLNTSFIKEDGILRIAGQKQKMETLFTEIEGKFYSNRTTIENLIAKLSAHELTGVLKKLIRELPDPIFTMELFDMFYKCHRLTLLEDKLRALNILVLLLPVEHRNTFKALLNFFVNICKNEQYNRMSVHNVAMITAPSLFPPKLMYTRNPKDPVSKEQLAKEINDAAVSCGIMELLLKSGESLWMIPDELVIQAQEAQKRAHDRKEFGKEKKMRSKKKLQRSSTQYEPGAMLNPKIKRDFIF